MNRIEARFKELRQRGEAAFIPFITAGDPDLPTTAALILDMERRGADIIELGFPFSDPIADGPVIQSSYNRALSNGATIAQIFDLIRDVRNVSGIPIVAMVSYSIVFRSGCRKFIKRARDAGLDGVTIPDLPVEEGEDLFKCGDASDFKVVCFVAPTTTMERMEMIATMSQGFLYYISVVGITGVRDGLPPDMAENIRRLRDRTRCPIAVGFGVSTPEQASTIGKLADGVIVGSAIVREIERYGNGSRSELVRYVGEFTERLISGVKGRSD